MKVTQKERLVEVYRWCAGLDQWVFHIRLRISRIGHYRDKPGFIIEY
jgi:hypothetical protein